MPKQTKPNEPKIFSNVCWVAADVKTLRPRWPLKKCEEFLGDIEKNLQGLMTERGWQVIEDELAVMK